MGGQLSTGLVAPADTWVESERDRRILQTAFAGGDEGIAWRCTAIKGLDEAR